MHKTRNSSVFCSWTVYFYVGPFWSSDLKVSFSNPYFNFWGTVAYFNGITGAYYSWYYTNFFVVLQINLTANLCKSLFFKVILSLTLRIIFYLIMNYFLQVAVSNFFLFFFCFGAENRLSRYHELFSTVSWIIFSVSWIQFSPCYELIFGLTIHCVSGPSVDFLGGHFSNFLFAGGAVVLSKRMSANWLMSRIVYS